MHYYLAVDIGASSGRHIVGWKEKSEIQTKEVYRFPNGVQEENGHLVWDVRKLFANVVRGVLEAFKQFPAIESLSIDTWGVDYVLLKGDREVYPVYAYRDASVAAYRAGLNLKEMTVAQSETEDVWNPGYEKSFGVQYEDVGSYSGEDNVFAAVKAAGHTRLILAGHDHIDNWVISYEGVTLAYGLKTGSACYWRPQLSGGTVVTVSADGIAGLRHEYVDASAFHEAK